MQQENDFRELLISARNGDNDSFEKIKEMYMPLINSKVASFSYCLEKDDIIQISYIKLFDAVKTYDEITYADKVTFGLYADICISRKLYSISERKRQIEVAYDKYDVDVSPEVTFVEKEEFYEELSKIRDTLTGYEFSVFRLHLKGLNQSEIATKLGKTRKSIENAMARVRKKLRSINDI